MERESNAFKGEITTVTLSLRGLFPEPYSTRGVRHPEGKGEVPKVPRTHDRPKGRIGVRVCASHAMRARGRCPQYPIPSITVRVP